jgi:hypothetical protein
VHAPFAHSGSRPHACPFAFFAAQVFADVQYPVAAQSASVVHDVVHAIPLHLYGAQSVMLWRQVPAPLQRSPVTLFPEHDAMPQTTVLFA